MTIRGLVDTDTGQSQEYSVGVKPNILINTNGKNIINQREATTVDHNAYGWDRWRAHSNNANVRTLSQQDGAARLTATDMGTATSIFFYQDIENHAHYRGRTLTLSVRMRASQTGNLLLADKTGSSSRVDYTTPGEWATLKVTRTIVSDSDFIRCWARCQVLTSGDWVEFEWIKLEEGDHATPYVIPDPALELKRCYRYFQAYGGETGGGLYQGFIDMYNRATNSTYGNFDFKAPMRAAPTVTISSPSHFCVQDKTDTHTLSALSLSNVTRTNAWAVGTTVGNPLVVGEKCLLESNNTTAARIYLDAEI